MLGNPTHTLPDFDGDNIDASLIDSTGAVDATDVDYADISTGEVATTDVTVSSVTGGIVTLSGSVTFTSVTGADADWLTVWKNSGSDSTSPLTISWDSATTGLPVTPNGGDIIATWGSNQLVTLSG